MDSNEAKKGEEIAPWMRLAKASFATLTHFHHAQVALLELEDILGVLEAQGAPLPTVRVSDLLPSIQKQPPAPAAPPTSGIQMAAPAPQGTNKPAPSPTVHASIPSSSSSSSAMAVTEASVVAAMEPFRTELIQKTLEDFGNRIRNASRAHVLKKVTELLNRQNVSLDQFADVLAREPTAFLTASPNKPEKPEKPEKKVAATSNGSTQHKKQKTEASTPNQQQVVVVVSEDEDEDEEDSPASRNNKPLVKAGLYEGKKKLSATVSEDDEEDHRKKKKQKSEKDEKEKEKTKEKEEKEKAAAQAHEKEKEKLKEKPKEKPKEATSSAETKLRATTRQEMEMMKEIFDLDPKSFTDLPEEVVKRVLKALGPTWERKRLYAFVYNWISTRRKKREEEQKKKAPPAPSPAPPPAPAPTPTIAPDVRRTGRLSRKPAAGIVESHSPPSLAQPLPTPLRTTTSAADTKLAEMLEVKEEMPDLVLVSVPALPTEFESAQLLHVPFASASPSHLLSPIEESAIEDSARIALTIRQIQQASLCHDLWKVVEKGTSCACGSMLTYPGKPKLAEIKQKLESEHLFPKWPIELQESLSTKLYHRDFIPFGSPVLRPYLSHSAYQNFKRLTASPPSLCIGDVLHEPFTPQEERLLELELRENDLDRTALLSALAKGQSLDSVASDKKFQKVIKVMVGRTAKDCLRFLQDKELGKYPNRAKLLQLPNKEPSAPIPAASSSINLTQSSSSPIGSIALIKSEPLAESPIEPSYSASVSLAPTILSTPSKESSTEKSSAEEEVWPHQRIVYEPRGICLKFFKNTERSAQQTVPRLLTTREISNITAVKNCRMGFASQLRSFGQCSVSSLPVSNIAEVRFQPDPKRPQLAVSCIRDPSAVHGAHEMLYLFDLTRGTARPLTGHTESVSDISFSGDGEFLISGSYDKTIKVWNSFSGDLVRTLPTPPPPPAGGGDAVLPEMASHRDKIARLAVHPNDSTLISAGSEGEVHVWNFLTGEHRAQLVANANRFGGVTELLVGSSNSQCANFVFLSKEKKTEPAADSNTDNGVVEVWDLETRSLRLNISEPFRSSVGSLALAPNSASLVAAGSEDKAARVFETRNGALVYSLAFTAADISKIAFSECERFVAVAGEDSHVMCYDVRFPLRPLHRLRHQSQQEKAGVMCLQWSKTNTNFLLSAGEEAVRVWDVSLASAEVRSPLRTHSNKTITSMQLSPLEDYLATGAEDHRIVLYCAGNGHSGNLRLTPPAEDVSLPMQL